MSKPKSYRRAHNQRGVVHLFGILGFIAVVLLVIAYVSTSENSRDAQEAVREANARIESLAERVRELEVRLSEIESRRAAIPPH